jgi:hypothetical protein
MRWGNAPSKREDRNITKQKRWQDSMSQACGSTCSSCGINLDRRKARKMENLLSHTHYYNRTKHSVHGR